MPRTSFNPAFVVAHSILTMEIGKRNWLRPIKGALGWLISVGGVYLLAFFVGNIWQYYYQSLEEAASKMQSESNKMDAACCCGFKIV